MLKETGEVTRQVAMLIVTIEGLEAEDEHPGKIGNSVEQLAGQGGKLQEVLNGLYRYKLKVVDVEVG